MYFFTADEHYDHENIIKYCNRPFTSVYGMQEILIANHNRVVTKYDITVHAGDFSFTEECAKKIIPRLNGNHIFVIGSHDKWLKNTAKQIWEKKIEGVHVVVCHYAMRTWTKSHRNSWQFYGHSHGRLAPDGKQWDVGVDNNNFSPVSFEKLVQIMSKQPDNKNLIK